MSKPEKVVFQPVQQKMSSDWSGLTSVGLGTKTRESSDHEVYRVAAQPIIQRQRSTIVTLQYRI